MKPRTQKQIFERQLYLNEQFCLTKQTFDNNSYSKNEYKLILEGLMKEVE